MFICILFVLGIKDIILYFIEIIIDFLYLRSCESFFVWVYCEYFEEGYK